MFRIELELAKTYSGMIAVSKQYAMAETTEPLLEVYRYQIKFFFDMIFVI